MRGNDPDDAARRIVVTPERVEQLAAIFQKTWQRPPTQRELEGSTEDFVKEEIYYREARAMGLDQDDTIIRRRLRQKLEFLTDELGSAPPTDEELSAYLEEHADVYRLPPLVRLRQVYFSIDRRGESVTRDAEELLDRLPEGEWPADGAQLGDPLLLTLPTDPLPPAEITRLFGRQFAEGVLALPVGEWSGPIRSGYGLHLVLITAREEGRMPDLEEARRFVERDLLAARRERVATDFYGELRSRYEIISPFSEATGPPSTNRLKSQKEEAES